MGVGRSHRLKAKFLGFCSLTSWTLTLEMASYLFGGLTSPDSKLTQPIGHFVRITVRGSGYLGSLFLSDWIGRPKLVTACFQSCAATQNSTAVHYFASHRSNQPRSWLDSAISLLE